MSEKSFLKLSELGNRIENLIRGNFPDSFWVLGEVSGHKFYEAQQRHYFDLIEKPEGQQDPTIKISAIAWRSGTLRIQNFEKETGTEFRNGIEVLLSVKLDYTSAYGLKLIVEDVDVNYTLGNLERQRRETLLKLVKDYPEIIQKQGEEYLTRNKKLDFPKVIQKVALIASTQSEGYHDFQHTLLNNQYQYCFGVDVFVSSVQGKEAEKELVNCLIRIFNSNTQYDAVVMIRGGGAKTDFHVYDSFKLALAVAKFPIPIITGIGHHKDESIVDLMAHSVTKTPTKAAEFIVSHNRKFEETILQFQQTIIIYSQQILSISNRNLSNLQYSISTSSRKFISDFRQSLRHSNQNIIRSAKNVLFTKSKNLLTQAIHVNTMPAGILNGKRIELQSLKMSFQSFTKTALQNQKSNLSHFESVVKLVDPVNMLKRGFAILSHNQKVIADPNEIKAGMKIEIQIKDEILTSQVLSKQNSNKKI